MVAPGFFQFDGLVADLDHIFGALIVVASVIAFADIVRYVRLANVVFALPVLVTQFFITDRLFFHAGLATLVVLFSLYHRKKNKSARNISV
jgi:hypothetical protein